MNNSYILRGQLGYNAALIANLLDWHIVQSAGDIPSDADWVFRWGNRELIPNGPKVINKAKAVKETLNKGVFRATCTNLGPLIWVHHCPDVVAEHLPVIVRPEHHSMSENLYFCETMEAVHEAINEINGDYYISEFIDKDRELRVFVFQGRALMVWDKEPPNKKNKISWGCVDAGRLIYVPWSEWPVTAVETAIKAFNKSKLDFGAVDIMMKGNKAYFLEINTAPEVWTYYAECISDGVKFMMENGRDRIAPTGYDNWKKMIHPCMTEHAEV